MTRIEVGKNEYLYCTISDNMSEWASHYSSKEEVMEDITPDIKKECKERGYTEDEIRKVINHYEVAAGMHSFWGE